MVPLKPLAAFNCVLLQNVPPPVTVTTVGAGLTNNDPDTLLLAEQPFELVTMQ